jgi:hypothetical protein
MSPQIDLFVKPGAVTTWDDFRNSHPCHSIALDGYVDAAPSFDPSGPYANFDHHHGVNRLATRSTSGQVLVAISLGLFDSFREAGQPRANIFVNDCDQDVCLSYWLLSEAERVRQLRIEMDIAKLIISEDFLDATAGAIPVDPSRPIMRKQAWVFEPYDQARASGRLSEMSGEAMHELIADTCDRITLLSEGKGEERDVVGEYDEFGGGPGWTLIAEHGAYARTKLFADGIRAFVAVRGLQEGRFTYSVGRMSPFINFPIAEIFERLNEAEGLTNSQDRWGGSDTIGGSPRRVGSQLSPTDVERIVNEVIGSNTDRG